MSDFQIPLTNTPQQFQINLAGVDYIMVNKWNDSTDGGWVLDISDALTNTPLAFNIPLVTGCNLLSGLEYLGINGILFVSSDTDLFAVPTLNNLGIESFLYFSTSANG